MPNNDLQMYQDNKLIFNENVDSSTYLWQRVFENLFEFSLDGTRVGHVKMFGTADNQDRAALLRSQDSDSTVYAMPLDKTGEAIQTAINSLPNLVSNGLVLLPAGNYSLQNTGIVVDKHQVTVKGQGVKLIAEYDGTDPAVWVRPPNGQKTLNGFSLIGNIAIERTVPDPNLVTTGLLLENVIAAVIDGISVRSFRSGIRLFGNDAGCAVNRLMLREVRDCVVGLTLEANVLGYVNQNTFIGGRFWTNQVMGSASGASHVVILENEGNDPNGNLFLHLSLEGFDINTTRAVICGGVANTFIDLRNEAVYGWEFTEKSARNLILGGRGIVPNSIRVDQGRGNAVYLIEEFNSHERVISSNIILSGTMGNAANPTRGLQQVIAIQARQNISLEPNPDPALADITGPTGMLCVNTSGELFYVSPSGRKTKLADG